METLYGKVSAPSAGERDRVQLEPQAKTQGKNCFKSFGLTEALDHLYLVCGWKSYLLLAQNKCFYVTTIVDQLVMVLLSPSPNLRRRKMLRKAVELTPSGDSSGAPHLLPRNIQVM